MVEITGTEKLIVADIRPRKETYYLVTEDSLKGIKGNNIWSDIFKLIASLLWGAYFSVLLTIKSSISIPDEIIKTLFIYQKIFLVSAIIVFIIAFVFLRKTYSEISNIKKSDIEDKEDLTTQSSQKFKKLEEYLYWEGQQFRNKKER